MKKRQIFLIFLLVLIVGVIAISHIDTSRRWESAENITVFIGAFEGDLQNAIDNDLFEGSPKSVGVAIISTSRGHSVEEILVSVNGNEMTFYDAISSTDLCGISSPTTSYSTNFDPGHYGTEIEVITIYDGQTKSLQDAINDGTLVVIDGDWSTWSDWSHPNGHSDGSGGTCSVSCGTGTQTRTRTCTNPAPFCGGVNCIGSSSELQDCNTQACPPPPPTTGTWQLSNCVGSFGQCIGVPCTAQGGSCTLGATTTCFIGSGFPGSCSNVCTLTCI